MTRSDVVVIPVYNHGAAIGAVVADVRAHGLPLILVDDGSEPTCAAVLDALASCFGPKARNPIEYHEKNWQEDPWSKGCPTGNFGPGTLLQFADALSEPVGRVHWAGTETAQEFCGFMEGAVESAERAVAEVSAALKSENVA